MSYSLNEPKNFQSWEEAFQYPIPTIRGIERQLKRDGESHAEKLRSLVGSSYQPLAAIADTIIEIDRDMNRSESMMNDFRKRSNPRTVEKKIANFHRWESSQTAERNTRMTVVAQIAVLRGCHIALQSALLATDCSVLIAAKILVISRLLYTKLIKRQVFVDYVETLRTRIARLRSKLLRRIDEQISTGKASQEHLLNAMAAYTLATSSSALDIVKHFHALRLQNISSSMQETSNVEHYGKSSMELLIQTIAEHREVAPTKLQAILARLRKESVLKSISNHDAIPLNLEVHERWLGDDIQNFAPFFRQDDLDIRGSQELLSKWSRQIMDIYVKGLERFIQTESSLSTNIKLRRQTLLLWLESGEKTALDFDTDVVDTLRRTFSESARDTICRQAAKLDQVIKNLERLLEPEPFGAESDITPYTLWDSAIFPTSGDRGGPVFRQRLLDVVTGRDHRVRSFESTFMPWLDEMGAIEAAFQQLRKEDWRRVSNLYDSEDDIENHQKHFAQEDPDLLQSYLSKQKSLNIRNLCSYLTDVVQAIEHGRDDTDISISKAIFLFRIWRIIRQKIPSEDKASLGQDSVDKLIQIIGDTVVADSSREYNIQQRFERSMRSRKFQIKKLWEGNPALPTLSSPWVFQFLTTLMNSLSAYGTDIWTAALMNRVKQQVHILVQDVVKDVQFDKLKHDDKNGVKSSVEEDRSNDMRHDVDEKLPEPSDSTTPSQVELSDSAAKSGEKSTISEGMRDESVSSQPHAEHESKTDPDSGLARDKRIQTVFDIDYLAIATEPSVVNAEVIKEPITLLRACSDSIIRDLTLDEHMTAQIQQNAEKYWTRTRLLFGLFS